MTAYVQGDERAFGLLFARWAPVLAGLFRRQVGPEEAGDLVQQTFLHLHRGRFDFAPGAKLRPWLFTIALNLGREQLRRRVRKPAVALELDPAAPPSTGASSELEGREEAARVRRAVSALPAAQREVIELHWFQGLPFAKVAELLGAKVGAVKVRAHRGYQRLRQLLEGDHGVR